MTRRSVFSLLLPVLFLSVGIGVVAVLVATRPQEAPTVASEKVWTVEVVEADPQTARPTTRLFGRIENPHTTDLSTSISADVLKLLVHEGESVGKGQLLMRLDDQRLRLEHVRRAADVKEVKARIAIQRRQQESDQQALEHELNLLELTRKALAREQTLVRSKSGSEARVDDARQALERQHLAVRSRRVAVDNHPPELQRLEANLERAQAELDQAQIDLEDTLIRAPFDARVTGVHVSPATQVKAGERLITLFDTDTLEIRAQIPGRYLAEVQKAIARGETLTAQGTIDGIPVTGELAWLAAGTQFGRGGVDGIFRVRAGGAAMQLGRTLELTLSLPGVPGLIAIPPGALYGSDRVYKVDEGRLVAVTVTRAGEAEPGLETRLLVQSPMLGAGDAIVTTQLPDATDGLRVRIATP